MVEEWEKVRFKSDLFRQLLPVELPDGEEGVSKLTIVQFHKVVLNRSQHLLVLGPADNFVTDF